MSSSRYTFTSRYSCHITLIHCLYTIDDIPIHYFYSRVHRITFYDRFFKMRVKLKCQMILYDFREIFIPRIFQERIWESVSSIHMLHTIIIPIYSIGKSYYILRLQFNIFMCGFNPCNGYDIDLLGFKDPTLLGYCSAHGL